MPAGSGAAWEPARHDWYVAGEIVKAMSLDELAGASIAFAYQGSTKSQTEAQASANLSRLGAADPDEAQATLGASGVAIVRTNADTAKRAFREDSAFAAVSPDHFFTAVDQEGGPVRRLSGDIEPPVAEPVLGMLKNPATAKKAARLSGVQLRAAGVDVVFAPVADVESLKSDASIAGRMFGSDAELVSKLTVAEVRGYLAEGLLPTVKHFPGLGAIAADTHTGTATYSYSRARWCRVDLAPFRAAVAAGVPMVMVGHGRYPGFESLPASGSRRLMVDLLRTEMGFRGIVITDAMSMTAAEFGLGKHQSASVRALKAGADIVLMPGNPVAAKRAIAKALANGNLSVDERRESIERLITYRLAQQRRAAQLQVWPAGSTELRDAAATFAADL